MPERAHVRSVEAIEAFRSHLIVYLDKARPVLEEVGSDLRRVQLWLETDQRLYWERRVLRCTRALEEAQQTLFSARLSDLREAGAFEQAAVHRARRDLEHAEDKLRRIKRWTRELGPRTESLTRQVNALDTIFSQEMARAVAWLTEVVRHLDAYAEVRPSFETDPPTPSAPGSEGEGAGSSASEGTAPHPGGAS